MEFIMFLWTQSEIEIYTAGMHAAADFFVLLLQLVAALHYCTGAICDKIKQSAEGAIQAVTDFVMKRGHELNEMDVSRCLIYKRNYELVTYFE